MGAVREPVNPPAGQFGQARRLLLPTRDLRLVGVDEQGLAVARNRSLVDHDLLHVGEGRQVEAAHQALDTAKNAVQEAQQAVRDQAGAAPWGRPR